MRRFALLVALALAGCSRGHVQTLQSAATGPLPRPAHVIVYDFAITPDEVKLDSGIGPTLLRSGMAAATDQIEAAQSTQRALSETLVEKLTKYGLQATRVAAGAVPPPDALLVQGQILSVNEGNRTRRTLIGLGAGKSSIEADTQLYYAADPLRPQFLVAFQGSADSGRMPGAAETLGAGAVADRLATSTALTAATHTGGEMRRTGVEANADKLAAALARQIGDYAVTRNWIPASAVH
jgi:Domain of unknown function (DUF4410)